VVGGLLLKLKGEGRVPPTRTSRSAAHGGVRLHVTGFDPGTANREIGSLFSARPQP